MIIYFNNAHRYINELKELKVKRLAFEEKDFKAYSESSKASLEDYLVKHLIGFKGKEFLVFKANGDVELNNKKLDYVEYPNEDIPEEISILVLKIPKLDPRLRVNKRSIILWLKKIIDLCVNNGIKTHLANQTSPNLAITFSKIGLTSFDIDLNIDSRFKNLILPNGKKVKSKEASRQYQSWCKVFGVSSTKISSGNLSEIFKFNIFSVLHIFKKGVTSLESKEKLTEDRLFTEKNLPQEVRELPDAFAEKDENKILAGLGRILKEESLRYYRARMWEKTSDKVDSEVTKIAVNISSKGIALLKLTKPTVTERVNQYFFDNRKIVISAMANELQKLEPEERNDLIKTIRQIRDERRL